MLRLESEAFLGGLNCGFTNVLDNICVESKNVQQIEAERKVVVARDLGVGRNGEMIKLYKLSVI